MVNWSNLEAKHKKYIVGGTIMLVLLFSSLALFPLVNSSYGTLTGKATSNTINDELSPKIEVDKITYNFGRVSQSQGIVSTTFILTNSGAGDLIIEGMETSCMCTSASIIYQGQEGPRFGMEMHGGMHGTNPKDYKLIIPPNDSATLKVYYDPLAHGKQKTVQEKFIREIIIKSNDPVNFQKKVRIEVTQVP